MGTPKKMRRWYKPLCRKRSSLSSFPPDSLLTGEAGIRAERMPLWRSRQTRLNTSAFDDMQVMAHKTLPCLRFDVIYLLHVMEPRHRTAQGRLWMGCEKMAEKLTKSLLTRASTESCVLLERKCNWWEQQKLFFDSNKIYTAEQPDILSTTLRWIADMFFGCWFAKWKAIKMTRWITGGGDPRDL